MYEELIEKLRGEEHTLGETFRLFYEAADAIEQLEAVVPKWIPVTERLPEEYVGVLC